MIMRKLEYSALVKKKMKSLKSRLSAEYGEEKAKKFLRQMTGDAERLEQFGESGVRISEMYDVETDYWYLFTHHHYLVYRIESEKVIIVQMFHEREDFMMKLFGITARIPADYVLFDSWFTSLASLHAIKKIGYDAIDMVKKTGKMYFTYNGAKMSLPRSTAKAKNAGDVQGTFCL